MRDEAPARLVWFLFGHGEAQRAQERPILIGDREERKERDFFGGEEQHLVERGPAVCQDVVLHAEFDDLAPEAREIWALPINDLILQRFALHDHALTELAKAHAEFFRPARSEIIVEAYPAILPAAIEPAPEQRDDELL